MINKTYFSNRKNKYNSHRTMYNGRYYDSALEASYAEELDWRKHAGEVLEWEPQYKIDLTINDIHITNYFIDFKVILSDNRVEYHEVKGKETDLWRLKWKLTQAIYPEYNLVLVK